MQKSKVFITTNFLEMDTKRMKYSPATFLNLERQYLSSLLQGKYSEVVPDSYKGRTHTLWDQFQAAFPAPMPIGDLMATMVFKRKAEQFPIKRCFSCGCDQCMEKLDADIPYFHSIMDDMSINGTPVNTRDYGASSPISVPEPSAQDAINSVIQVCHFYTTYAICGYTNDEDPETPAFTRIRFKAKISDDADEKRKKWARRMAMTPTKLVFKK